MTWYNDPDVGPPAGAPQPPPPVPGPPPGGPGQMPAPPPAAPQPPQAPAPGYPAPPPGAQPPPPGQPPYGAQPGYPAPPPGAQPPPPGQPPYGGQPPGGQPPYGGQPGFPAPPPGPGGGGGGGINLNDNRVRLAIVGVLAVFTLIVGYLIFSGPTEVSVKEFAKGSCKDVLKPKYKEIRKLFDDVEDEEDVNSEKEAQAAIDATRKMVELIRDTAEEYGDYSDGHILKGSDGEDFQEEVSTAVSDYVEDLDGVLDDVDELDPADEEDVVPDIQEIFMDLGGLDINTDSDEPGGEVLQETTEDDEDCGGLLAIMIYGRIYGD